MGPSVSHVRLYTKRWCGFCFLARRLLSKIGIDFDEIRLDRNPELRRTLSQANGNWPTVPMIFVGDHFVGGYTELAGLHRRGILETLIEERT